MGFLSTIKAERARVIDGGHPNDHKLAGMFGWTPTAAGIDVDEMGAFGLAAYYAAIRNISEDVAKLPIGIYTRSGQARNELDHDPVTMLLNHSPNPECTPLTFRQTMMVHALGWGRGLAEIEWAANHKPMNLWPVHPRKFTIDREKSGQRRVVFLVSSDRLGRTVTLYDEDVFHIPGMGFDGLTGVSVIQHARESLGLAMAADRFGAGFFGSSGIPALLFKLLKPLQDDGKRLKETWGDAHKPGAKNRGMAVVPPGIEIEKIGIPPEDSQFLQTRQFQIVEIARWFRMPPHKLQDLTRGTFSNIEHQSIEYVGDCISPWLLRWEQEIARKFFGRGDRRYARHNVAALLRADTESRYRAHAIAIQWGWRNPDGAAALEDENPLPDSQGKAYMRPANMIPADQFGKEPKGDSAPPPPANPENGNQNRASLRPLLESYRTVLQDAISRALRVETDRIGRNAKRADFEAWAEGFYTEQRDNLRGLVFPVAEALASIATAAGVAGINPADLAGGIVDRHVANSRARLTASDGAEAITSEINGWQDSRAEAATAAELSRIIDLITGA